MPLDALLLGGSALALLCLLEALLALRCLPDHVFATLLSKGAIALLGYWSLMLDSLMLPRGF